MAVHKKRPSAFEYLQNVSLMYTLLSILTLQVLAFLTYAIAINLITSIPTCTLSSSTHLPYTTH